MARFSRWAPLVLAVPLVAIASCSRGGAAAVKRMEAELRGGDEAALAKTWSSLPACVDPPLLAGLPNPPPAPSASAPLSPRELAEQAARTQILAQIENPKPECIEPIAKALGAKNGFSLKTPDTGTAGTLVTLLLRDGHGEWLPSAEGWMNILVNGKGTGSDAVRFAVARAMMKSAPAIGKKVATDEEGRAFLRAVANAVPGACRSYRIEADRAPGQAVPPQLEADHAPCVQHDLARREGPGAEYGMGLWRAAAGALAVWTAQERALRMGLGQIESADGRALVETALVAIEAATRGVQLKQSDPRVNAGWEALMQQVHEGAWSPSAAAAMSAAAQRGGAIADGGAPPSPRP